jgi:hypothetical protein
VRRALALLGVAAVAACSSLPNAGNGVVQLRVFTPDSLFLYPDSSLTLRAVAFDLNGDSVAAPVRWRTPDTTLVTVDSASGVVTSRLDTVAQARVQASTGTLLSSIITIQLRHAPADSTTTAGLRSRP